jgi:hypothetical protein
MIAKGGQFVGGGINVRRRKERGMKNEYYRKK